MNADAAAHAAVADVLDRFCAGFAARDADAVLGVFAPSGEVAMVTSEEPLLRGRAEIEGFLRRYAAGETTYSWVWSSRDVHRSGAVAWLLAVGTETARSGSHAEEHPYRMTLVCVQRGDDWLLVQIHGSSPHAG